MEKLLLPIVIEKDADGYFAYCPQLQGCYTQGDTYEEALENIRDAIKLHIKDRLAEGEPLPKLEAVSVTTVEIPLTEASLKRLDTYVLWMSDFSEIPERLEKMHEAAGSR
jgi:predicted RNase H-like HicB family nuclease